MIKAGSTSEKGMKKEIIQIPLQKMSRERWRVFTALIQLTLFVANATANLIKNHVSIISIIFASNWKTLNDS